MLKWRIAHEVRARVELCKSMCAMRMMLCEVEEPRDDAERTRDAFVSSGDVSMVKPHFREVCTLLCCAHSRDVCYANANCGCGDNCSCGA